jgi:hypothetical protein
LPRLVACAASQVAPSVRVEGDRAPASLGTAFHACMAAIASGRPYDVDAAAAEHNVPADELGPMVGWAARLWRDQLSDMFPDPLVEHPLGFSDEALALTGHLDILSVVEDEIRILDWKSGWADEDASEQLNGYGFLAQKAFPEAKTVRLTKLAVRHQKADTRVTYDGWLQGWWNWLKTHLLDSSTYRTGKHCGNCPRARECPGHAQQLRWLALALNGGVGCDVDLFAPEHLAATLAAVKVLGRRCDEFAEAVKAHVEAHGGRYGPLALVEKGRSEIDVWRAWEVLTDTLPSDELIPTLRVTKDKLETAVKARAPRGQKGQAVKDMYAGLDAAGAIVRTTHLQLEVLPDGDSTAIADGERPAADDRAGAEPA